MVVDGDFVNFRAVYDELTDEVERASYQFLPDHIRNWFKTLDTTPRVATVIRELQEGLDFQAWFQEVISLPGFTMSGGRIVWPEDDDQALGMKLLLFRAFAQGKPDISGFGLQFFHAGTGLDANARAVVNQIFGPMARELRRYLERELREIPAADRLVRLDHNSTQYSEAMAALETLQNVLCGANDYPDADERERIVAEISATRRIFQAVMVRVEVVVSLLVKPLTYLAKTFAGAAIGQAANKVVEAITSLISGIF